MKVVAWLLVVCLALSAAPTALADSLDDALARIGMHRSQIHFDRHEMALWGGDRLKLRWFDALVDRPWRVPVHAQLTYQGAVEAGLSVHQQLARLTGKLDAGVRRAWIEDPQAPIQQRLDQDTEPVVAALRELHAALGAPLAEADLERLRAAVEPLPPLLQRALARLLFTLPAVLRWRELAFREVPGANDQAAWQAWLAGKELEEDGYARLRWPEWVDYPFLYAGAMDLVQAVEATMKDLEALPPEQDARFEWETPRGAVRVAGRGADTHNSPALLLIELGGDDRYTAGGAGLAPARPVGVLIDLAGNDTYDASEDGRGAFGAGIGGYGLLYDLSGSDSYRVGSLGLGAGVFGLGALVDRTGDDRYQADAMAQGGGQFGIGLLLDGGGSDRYQAYTQSQGYGYIKGAGLLLDLQGDDVYVANDTDIRYASPQTAEHNTSLCQGFGYGRRADYTDGHSLAGGIGLLVDAQGNDSYSCGVFGQGGGYWYGIGLLADGGGDDTYAGVWYVQATGAHFAAGILWDRAGNDSYTATHNMAQGAGHDFSLGFLLDEAGNDRYQAPNLSLGGGNANGIGVFLDLSGDDSYTSTGTTLGRATVSAPGSMRESLLCLGLFLDLDGDDSYGPHTPWAGNSQTWTYPLPDSGERPRWERGVGGDVQGGAVSWD